MALLDKLATRAKIITDKRHRDFFLQRSIRDIGKREQASMRVAETLPPVLANAPAEAIRLSEGLEKDGYVMLDGLFPKSWAADMRQYFEVRTCSDPYRKELGTFVAPAGAPKPTHVAFFDSTVVVKAPHIFDMVNHPFILHAVSTILGAKPTIAYMAVWWSLAAGDGTAQQAENFHRDVDDLRFVKFFTYLTDVDEDSGPHVYVPGSHRQNKLTKIRRYSDEEIVAAFGPECEKRFVGPAGTAFLENTYGFHRGYPAKTRPRLAIGVTYSLRPIPYGPAKPVCRIGDEGVPASLDPYINRVYCAPA